MKLKIYEELKQEVLNCSKCDLCEDGKIGDLKPQVMGEGNLNSKILFVAQNPGVEEVKHSQPLTTTGTSGKLYEKVLNYLDLTREQVYTTNIVLCHSPKNAEPENYQLLKCQPYFERQLDLIKPELIITFGRYSAQFFLNNFKITSDHGKIQRNEKYNADIFPLFHPAYVSSYAPQAKRFEFQQDIQKLKEIIKAMNKNVA